MSHDSNYEDSFVKGGHVQKDKHKISSTEGNLNTIKRGKQNKLPALNISSDDGDDSDDCADDKEQGCNVKIVNNTKRKKIDMPRATATRPPFRSRGSRGRHRASHMRRSAEILRSM